MWPSLVKIWYTELKLCGNLCGRPPAHHTQSHNTARLETGVYKLPIADMSSAESRQNDESIYTGPHKLHSLVLSYKSFWLAVWVMTFEISTNQKYGMPMTVMFLARSILNHKCMWRSSHTLLVPTNISFRLVVS